MTHHHCPRTHRPSLWLLSPADEQVEQLQQRASAAASQLEDAVEDEDQRELEAFAQLRTVRELLQAAKRCCPTLSVCRDTVQPSAATQQFHLHGKPAQLGSARPVSEVVSS